MAKSETMRSLTRVPEQPDPTADELLGSERPAPEVTAPEPAAGVVVTKTPAMDALVQWLESMCDVDPDDTSAGLESIIHQTLAASDMAAVLRQTLPK